MWALGQTATTNAVFHFCFQDASATFRVCLHGWFERARFISKCICVHNEIVKAEPVVKMEADMLHRLRTLESESCCCGSWGLGCSLLRWLAGASVQMCASLWSVWGQCCIFEFLWVSCTDVIQETSHLVFNFYLANAMSSFWQLVCWCALGPIQSG